MANVCDLLIGHSAEPAWIGIRLITLLLALWELRDACVDVWWQYRDGDDPLRLMLAKWRVVQDVFITLLSILWVVLGVWIYRRPHGPNVDVVMAWQNGLVVLLLVQTIYLRRIRVLIRRDGMHRRRWAS